MAFWLRVKCCVGGEGGGGAVRPPRPAYFINIVYPVHHLYGGLRGNLSLTAKNLYIV